MESWRCEDFITKSHDNTKTSWLNDQLIWLNESLTRVAICCKTIILILRRILRPVDIQLNDKSCNQVEHDPRVGQAERRSSEETLVKCHLVRFHSILIDCLGGWASYELNYGHEGVKFWAQIWTFVKQTISLLSILNLDYITGSMSI